MSSNANTPAIAGFGLKEWCDAVGYCRATYYNLPAELQPHTVKIGKRRIVREAPADYLQRIAQAAKRAA